MVAARFSKVVLTLVAVGLAAGCTLEKDIKNWAKQNPFADKADDIQNGQPPSEKPEPKPIISADAIRIDSVMDSLEFEEGQGSSYKFGFRIFVKNVSGVIRVEGLEELTGASFDASTGELNWTPASDFVRKTGENFRKFLIKVVVDTDSANSFVADRIFPVTVNRSTFRPQLQEITDSFSDNIIEGGSKDFSLKVIDKESSQTKPPHVSFFDPHGSYDNGSSMIGCREPFTNPSAPDLWIFNCRISAPEEITNREKTFGFAMQVTSGYGTLSQIMSEKFAIETRLYPAEWSIPDSKVEFKNNKDNALDFLVMDRRKEGRLKISFDIESLPVDKPENKSLKCEALTSQADLWLCHLKWKVPKKTGKTYDIPVKVTTESTISWSKQTPVETELNLEVRVSN